MELFKTVPAYFLAIYLFLHTITADLALWFSTH